MKIELVEIDHLFPCESDYNRAKLKYIADYEEYQRGGFLSMGYFKKEPLIAEARWNKCYPNGFTDWRAKDWHVNYPDMKYIMDKMNEIIQVVNSYPQG